MVVLCQIALDIIRQYANIIRYLTSIHNSRTPHFYKEKAYQHRIHAQPSKGPRHPNNSIQ